MLPVPSSDDFPVSVIMEIEIESAGSAVNSETL
jgi:hypothetical protein